MFDALTLHPPFTMEVVVICGARRISSYSGYLSTFRWGVFWPGRCDQGRSCEASTPLPSADVKPEAMTVLVMDAQIVERCTRSSQGVSRSGGSECGSKSGSEQEIVPLPPFKVFQRVNVAGLG